MPHDLPPMPNRRTGEPRPPEAPISSSSNEPAQPWRRRKVPQPPTGEGSPLEWCYSDARIYRWVLGISVGLLVILLTAKDFFDSLDSPGYTWWFETWWGWGLVAGVGVLMLLVGRTFRISAGADWFMDRNTLIKTYELVEVAVEKDMSEGDLHLRDKRGQQISVGLASMRSNEALWDLVYNGIRHSVANGAQVNRMAVERLQLWGEIRMREDKWFDQRRE